MVEVKGTLEELHELFGGSPTSTRKGGKRKTARRAYEPKKKGSASRKGKPMSRKTQLAINRGRRAKGIKPIKWKKKGK